MVRPLQYNAGLDLQEAEERYGEISDAFKKVESHYSRPFGIIREEDSTTLVDCIGVLLPLGLEASVQDQIRKAQNFEDTLLHRIEQLNWQIMDYLANFENTEVTRWQ